MTFQSLKQGRFPEWDPTIYSGLSFVGNVQAQLFYPPAWLMYGASLHKRRLTYETLQIFVIVHVWIGFLLCYLWLRSRRLTDLACILGAGVFAFSGYMCLQLQHLGLIAGYVWFPLGLMGIDQAFERRRWKPLLMLVAASALCFLAGYPPTWFVFAICMVTYAVARSWRSPLVAGTVLSLGVSLLLAMIQLYPAWELTGLKIPESRYGTGIKQPVFYLSYLLPNYFNFGRNVSILHKFRQGISVFGRAGVVRHRLCAGARPPPPGSGPVPRGRRNLPGNAYEPLQSGVGSDPPLESACGHLPGLVLSWQESLSLPRL